MLNVTKIMPGSKICKLRFNTQDKLTSLREVLRCIQCDSCRVKFHTSKKCSLLSATEQRAFELGKRMLVFFCEDCLHSNASFVEKCSELEDEVNDLKNEVTNLKSGSDNYHRVRVLAI